LGGSASLCLWARQAAADDTSFSAVFSVSEDSGAIRIYKRHLRHLKKGENSALPNEDEDDAKGFAARLKQHQRRHFSQRKREFRKQQQRLEAQRRSRKAKLKAHQFAAARRHAAENAPKHKLHTTRKPAHEGRINPVGNLAGGL
jgi:exonuclease VII large subunit